MRFLNRLTRLLRLAAPRKTLTKTRDSMRYFKRVKDNSINLIGLSREMYFAWGVVHTIYRSNSNPANCIVTSANDGTHMSDSKHYSGDALDFRVWGFQEAQIQAVVNMIQRVLGDDYDVVNEYDHIHVEYDPERK